MDLHHKLVTITGCTLGVNFSCNEAAGPAVPTKLLHLACLRAAQIRRSATNIARYWSELRESGESEHRLYLLDAWREASIFTPSERAALAFTEAMLGDDRSARHATCLLDQSEGLGEAERLALGRAVANVSSSNRLGIQFRAGARAHAA
jgi:alkylhydroperoxidase family enzyme